MSKTSKVKKKTDFDAAKLLDFINNRPGHLWDLQFDIKKTLYLSRKTNVQS
jgi:hypothetical protein